MQRHAIIPSTLGDLLATADDEQLTGLYFPGHRYPPAADTLGPQIEPAASEVFAATLTQLTAYLEGERTSFDVHLAPRGDAFSHQVWERLRAIPYGATVTYGQIATELGNRNLAQRVGQAVGHNPVSIIIPCHRVVGSDGSLTGYAGGLDRKRHLLALESPNASEVGRLF